MPRFWMLLSYVMGEGNCRFKRINVTAISNATLAQEKTSSIYDLSGRKSNKLQKGIYIVNGKKIIVK